MSGCMEGRTGSAMILVLWLWLRLRQDLGDCMERVMCVSSSSTMDHGTGGGTPCGTGARLDRTKPLLGCEVKLEWRNSPGGAGCPSSWLDSNSYSVGSGEDDPWLGTWSLPPSSAELHVDRP
ncbi:hypothetical protein BCR39DRAFT_547609 [Naematelia encephala]|uniref:Secreted protein n=1 Tax=Naematelia encephala TaxID=71784 RepID=A0A1Y2ANG9_9TREE|nr:hypothetical protein BCR39DRAFT_547609 [Naematelia encephala]